MSHLRVYLLAFCVFGVVVAAFAAENVNCEEEVSPGSEDTTLSPTEETLKTLKGKVEGIWNKWPWKKFEKAKSSRFGDVLNELNAKDLALILPGTRWCGDGDNAKDENDLGLFKDTDACCRAHDNCNSNIAAGETLSNLNNNGIFTRSACSCDKEFYDCLRKVDSSLSYAIGWTYFDMVRPQCFQCICPTNNCEQDCEESCSRYEWRNNPRFEHS